MTVASGPSIRRGGASDATGIAACHARCFADNWGAEVIARLLADPVRTAWVVETGSKVVGFLIAAQAADEIEILSVGVDPSARRAGTARALLARLDAHAAAHRALRIFLEVASANEAARSLYQASGYVEVGRRRGYYRDPAGGPADDALVLQKLVTPLVS